MSSTQQEPGAASERRRFYRIRDRVALKFRELPESELPRALDRLQNGMPEKALLAASFATTSNQLRHVNDRIRKDQPDLATYLQALNDKLDTVVRVLSTSEQEMPLKASHDVSLSACGLAFRSASAIADGAVLELKLLLFPSHINLYVLATVAHCREHTTAGSRYPYHVGVDFSYIRENDRDLLIKHVLKKQSDELRQARQEGVSQPEG